MRVEGLATVRELQKAHGAEGFLAILHLNRIDLDHLRDGATLIVPESPASMTALSPFPPALGPAAPSSPKLLVVSRRVQAFAAYEGGLLVRWGAVSTGRRETPTPAGLFATNWRSKLRRSSDNAAWLLPWYVNFINSSGVSFHQFDLPGYPASHACVRLLEADAKWIFDWAESWVLADQGRRVEIHGTPVLVFDDYAFDAPAPWLKLPQDAAATTITRDAIESALQPHKATIEERAAARAAWLKQKSPLNSADQPVQGRNPLIVLEGVGELSNDSSNSREIHRRAVQHQEAFGVLEILGPRADQLVDQQVFRPGDAKADARVIHRMTGFERFDFERKPGQADVDVSP